VKSSPRVRRASSRTFLICTAIASVAVLVGCGKTGQLSEAPPNGSQAAAFDTTPSTVGALATIPIAEIKALVNAKVPPSYSASGDGEEACTRILGQKACIGTRYSLNARRTGEIGVEAAGPSALRMTLPVSFDGKGGFSDNGEIGKRVIRLLSLGARNFNGALVISADLTPVLGEDWCPKLNVAVTYRWTSDPRVEIVSKVNVSVKGEVEKAINDKLPDLVAAARDAIGCTKFNAEVAKVYGSRTFPVDIPNVGKVHINITPTNIAFSGLSVTPCDVSAAVAIAATVDMSGTPLTPALLPLPKLTTIKAEPPVMSVAVTIRAPYTLLTTAVTAAVAGRTFEQETPAGKAKIKVTGVEVYPSNGKIVVGVDVAADMPSGAPDAKGEIYLLATPKVEGGTKISLPDASYTTALNSTFWSAASALFEGPIKKAIRDAAVYDLTNDVVKARDAIAKAIADPALAPGLKVSISNVDMKLGRVAVADKEFAAEGLFSAAAIVVASAAAIKP
jgi:Domain of unknown function (DUF4403)